MLNADSSLSLSRFWRLPDCQTLDDSTTKMSLFDEHFDDA